MRIATKPCLVFIVFVLAGMLPSRGTAQGKILAFEGKVVAVNTLRGLPISCGVAAPHLLIKYEIDKLYAGAYNEKEIIIDHLACGASGVLAIDPGDNVVVVAKLVHNVPEEIDSLELRRQSRLAKHYFLALSVGRRIYTFK